MMMPFKILQSKEIDLQQLPMMSEITLLTTSTVIMVLLNAKMIVHKIKFKIKVFILDKGTLMLSNLLVGCQLANQKSCMKNVFFLSKKVVGHMTCVNHPTGQPLCIKVKILHLWWVPQGTINNINILYRRKGLKSIYKIIQLSIIFVNFINSVPKLSL